MMIEGFPVCEDEECLEFFSGPVEVTFEGKTYHYECLHPSCEDCLAEFEEFEPWINLHLGQLEEAGGCAVLDERCALPPCMRSQEDSACRPCPTPASGSEPRAHHACRRVCGARRRSGAWERCAPLVPAR